MTDHRPDRPVPASLPELAPRHHDLRRHRRPRRRPDAWSTSRSTPASPRSTPPTATPRAAVEEMLGELLRGRRDQVVLATKAGIYPGDAGGRRCCPRTGLRSSLDGSLRRLGTDHVDLFYLHQPDRSVPLAETAAALADARRGRAGPGHRGLELLGAGRSARSSLACEQVGAPRPVLAQQLYNLLARRIEDEYVEFAQTHQVGDHRLQPARRRPADRTTPVRQQPPAEGDSATPGSPPCTASGTGTSELFDAVDALSRDRRRRRDAAAGAGAALAAAPPSRDLGAARRVQARTAQANIAAAGQGPLADDVITACDEVGAALRRTDARLQPLTCSRTIH